RTESRKLDLPEAFGPIRKTLPCRATSTATKLRQLASRNCENRRSFGSLEVITCRWCVGRVGVLVLVARLLNSLVTLCRVQPLSQPLNVRSRTRLSWLN